MCNKIREGLIFSKAGGKMETNTIKYCTRAARSLLPTLTNPRSSRKHAEFSSVLPRVGLPSAEGDCCLRYGWAQRAWWLSCTQTAPQAAENRTLIIWNLLAVGLSAAVEPAVLPCSLGGLCEDFCCIFSFLISPDNLPSLVPRLPLQSFFGTKFSRQLS